MAIESYNLHTTVPLFEILLTDESPTSVDFIRDEANHIVTAYNSSNCIIFDCETGKPVVRFEINQVHKFLILLALVKYERRLHMT